MSYLIRVLLPDTPGSLGSLAEAFGQVNANIQSVDIVESFPDGTVMDDIVVGLPTGVMADSLVSAANQCDGVLVDSIRPFSGRVDRRGQIEMLADVASFANNPQQAMERLVATTPQSMTATWAIVLDTSTPVHRVAASSAAPEDSGVSPETIPVEHARVLLADSEEWIPSSWGLLESRLAATPLVGTSLVLVVGRTAGPDFLASEVDHLGLLGKIVGKVLS